MEVSRRVAASFGRVSVVASLACTALGVGFALLTSCSDAVVGKPNKPPYDDGGSVPNPDGTIPDSSGTIMQPDGAVGDGPAVDSGAGDSDGATIAHPDGVVRDMTAMDSGAIDGDG